MKHISVVIMAAGEGTRMRSNLPKVMHQVAGRSLLEWVAAAVAPVSKKPIVVYGSGGDKIPSHYGERFSYALQSERLGTGHAVMMAKEEIRGSDYTVVIAGDMPLVKSETIEALVEKATKRKSALAILTASPEITPAYGRVLRDEKGKILRIVEEKDATEAQKQIKELNISVYCFATKALLEALEEIKSDNAQGEYYLTDTIEILASKGYEIESLAIDDIDECMGVNTRVQLAETAEALRGRINEALMLSGVSIIDPKNTYIDADVCVGQDTVIYPNVILEGNTKIGAGCTLYQGSRITNSIVGDNTTIENTVLQESSVGSDSQVGPYAYLRPNTVIGNGCRVGDFVETKNAKIGNGTKISHLTYVGDAELGEEINIGCGVVFVNYDGKEKHITKVGDGAFIGCNTNLVSPVDVGAGAYIAAGSTVTKNVPEDAFVIARAREVIKEGWAKGRYPVKKEKK